MTYPKTDAKANFPELERQILDFWRTDDTFHKSLARTDNDTPFNFYDGPPFANGLPHWGHLSVSAVKDMVSRYQTMTGHFVRRELGWDCHGLPAENSVEKKIGKTAPKIVADDGMAAFCDMCRTDVMEYTTEWKKFLARIGRWVETADGTGYRTMDMRYMECVIGTMRKLYADGLLYKDYRVNPFDWKLGTVLSNSEASADYRDVVDDAVTVWFQLSDGRRILAWTTTPWTLPANSALAVNPAMKYVVMRDTDNAEYIIAETRLGTYEKQFDGMERVGELMGTDLVGLKYTPLFPYYSALCTLHPALYTIIPADYVSDADGTGIVHIAPAFGEDDFWAAKNLDPKFPVILNVDDYGNFDKTVRDFAGENIFVANPKIIEMLRANGHLVKKEQHKHSYPFGERSGEKLIYRATDSWYIDVPRIREKLIANNNKVNWTSAGERFKTWIAGARPWAISRNRFWGTPLPIWKRGDEYMVFGSVSEMESFFGVKITDLHRPTLDALSRDGWTRIPDVLDCWVESGSMPWASIGFNPWTDAGKPANFPADYIIEGQDQTRGWFYSLMVLATAVFDAPAFMTVSANGMILDEHKKKLSKSLHNYTDPTDQIEQSGADAIRLFVLSSNFMKAESVPIDKQGKVFAEPTKTILTPLWNAYHFFTLYANAGAICAKTDYKQSENILDQYIIAELDNVISVARNALDAYTPDRACREFVRFLDILNNWYIRLNRTRFWDEDQTAFDTLYFVLTRFCRVLAPFAPFISEYIYKNLTGAESVHLCEFPTSNPNTESDLLQNMRHVMDIVSVGKQLREKYKLRNRLPLAGMPIYSTNELDAPFTKIIREELNVKNVFVNHDVSSVADNFVYLITPKIGARLGGALREIMTDVKAGNYKIENTELITPNGKHITSDEYEIRLAVRDNVNGLATPDNTAVVVIDTNITPELTDEGLANDALRFIQDTRKTCGFDVSDRIQMTYSGDNEMLRAIIAHKSRIMSDALITDMSVGAGEYETMIEGHQFAIQLTTNK